MCNLYNITTSQEAIRQWTRALRDIAGNLEPSIDIYPLTPCWGQVTQKSDSDQGKRARFEALTSVIAAYEDIDYPIKAAGG